VVFTHPTAGGSADHSRGTLLSPVLLPLTAALIKPLVKLRRIVMLKGLICAIFWVCLLWVAIPARADGDTLGTSLDFAEAAEKESQEPSKRGPAGRSLGHHPEHPVKLPNTTGPIVTDNAITQTYKDWTAQITPTMNFIGGVFNSNWQRRSPGANQPTRKLQISDAGDYKSFSVPAQLTYGLAPRLDVSVTVPFMQNWASNVGPLRRAANFGSLGDSSLQLRYMFLNGSPTATTVTGYLSVLFPTGHASPLEPKLLGIDQTGGGAFGFTWGFEVFKYVPQVPILFYAMSGTPILPTAGSTGPGYITRTKSPSTLPWKSP
jgi:hypothetical protein